MSENKGFTEREKDILDALYKSIRPMSTKEVADRTEYAWETCAKVLKRLKKDKYVIQFGSKKDKEGKTWRTWKFNYARQRMLKDKKKKI